MRVIATNGCFDVLHAGHVDILRAARRLGDWLTVGLNSDESVRKLKGSGRPLQPQTWRKMVLEELRCVNEVIIVDEDYMCRFLERVKPALWVKGGDYTLETLDQREVATARALGIDIRILPVRYDIHTKGILAS